MIAYLLIDDLIWRIRVNHLDFLTYTIDHLNKLKS